MFVRSIAASAHSLTPARPQAGTAARGATMVEFAIGAATFFFLLIGGIEVARYLYTVQRVQHVLNELSRASIMGRLPEQDKCTAGQPITSECRAKSIAAFLKQRYTALQLTIDAKTQFGMCVNVSTSAVQCKANIDGGNSANVCYPKTNSTCSGLDAGDASSANQYVYLQIIQPIDLFLHVITLPIKAGVVVKNEPFQEEG
jgi:Flp pilus assembly protein TadG